MKATLAPLHVLMVIILCVCVCAAQEVVPFSERLEKLEDHPGNYAYTPAPGDKLVYAVTYPDGKKYSFTVTLTRYNMPPGKDDPYPIAFNWTMGAPLNTTGSVEICQACLTDMISYKNYFAPGSHIKLDDASTVFLSGRNFYEPLQQDDRKTSMIMDGKEIVFYDKNETLDSYGVTIAGKKYSLLSKRYSNEPNMMGNRSVTVLAGGGRLILSMNLEFNISLQQIIPAA